MTKMWSRFWNHLARGVNGWSFLNDNSGFFSVSVQGFLFDTAALLLDRLHFPRAQRAAGNFRFDFFLEIDALAIGTIF